MLGRLITQAAPNTFYLVPDYVRVDAGLSWERAKNERWKSRFAVNADNLLDRCYFY